MHFKLERQVALQEVTDETKLCNKTPKGGDFWESCSYLSNLSFIIPVSYTG